MICAGIVCEIGHSLMYIMTDYIYETEECNYLQDDYFEMVFENEPNKGTLTGNVKLDLSIKYGGGE